MLWGTIRNRETFERSTDLFEKAIAEDPSYGEPYAGLAIAQVLNWQFHWTDDWSQSLEKAERHLDLALQKSPQVAFVHYVASVFYLWKKDLDRSAAEADAALNLNPNYALALNSRGIVNIYGGEPLAAVPDIERAMRLDPMSSTNICTFSVRPIWSPASSKPPRRCSRSVSSSTRRPIFRAPFSPSRSAIWARPRKPAGSGAS